MASPERGAADSETTEAEAATMQSVEIETPSETSKLVERPPAPKANCLLMAMKRNDAWYWSQPSWKRVLLHCVGFWCLILWLFAILGFISGNWLAGIVNCLLAMGQAAFDKWAIENRVAPHFMLAESLFVIAVAVVWPIAVYGPP